MGQVLIEVFIVRLPSRQPNLQVKFSVEFS